MHSLITGSLAYDYLIRIDGGFSDRWPASPNGEFTAAYIASSLQRRFGGCAGNIAYALRCLGGTPILMATAGDDFLPYAEYLHGQKIDTSHIAVLEGFYTAQAYVATDAGNNQFVIFHPGATGEAHRQSLKDAPECSLAIVSPNGKQGMLQHCQDLSARAIPFIFDPGQAIGMFSAEELLSCLRQSTYAIVNVDEWKVLHDKTGLSKQAIADMVDALLVTFGADGSEVTTNGEVIKTGSVTLGETQDPTGCGDAYRAGLIYGLLRQWDWQRIIRFATIVAGIKATHDSAQGYALSLQQVEAIYQREFGGE